MLEDDPLVTRERACELLDGNRRTIGKALVGVPPEDAGPPLRWHLSTVREALAARAQRVGSGGAGHAGSVPGDMARVCVEIEFLGDQCAKLLERLRAEPDTAKRLDILQADGAVVGGFVAALDRSVALTDDVQRPISEFFVTRAIVGPLLSEIFGLAGITQAELNAFATSA